MGYQKLTTHILKPIRLYFVTVGLFLQLLFVYSAFQILSYILQAPPLQYNRP